MLKLTIEIEEPPYEQDVAEAEADDDVEDVMFSPPHNDEDISLDEKV